MMPESVNSRKSHDACGGGGGASLAMRVHVHTHVYAQAHRLTRSHAHRLTGSQARMYHYPKFPDRYYFTILGLDNILRIVYACIVNQI